MTQPTVNRPTFNPDYFMPGRAFQMYARLKIKSQKYEISSELEYSRVNVLVRGISDRGETLNLATVISVGKNFDFRQVEVDINEAPYIEFKPLEVLDDGAKGTEKG